MCFVIDGAHKTKQTSLTTLGFVNMFVQQKRTYSVVLLSYIGYTAENP